jgi:hypothetical protein
MANSGQPHALLSDEELQELVEKVDSVADQALRERHPGQEADGLIRRELMPRADENFGW